MQFSFSKTAALVSAAFIIVSHCQSLNYYSDTECQDFVDTIGPTANENDCDGTIGNPQSALITDYGDSTCQIWDFYANGACGPDSSNTPVGSLITTCERLGGGNPIGECVTFTAPATNFDFGTDTTPCPVEC